jgi:hypothetical protein
MRTGAGIHRSHHHLLFLQQVVTVERSLRVRTTTRATQLRHNLWLVNRLEINVDWQQQAWSRYYIRPSCLGVVEGEECEMLPWRHHLGSAATSRDQARGRTVGGGQRKKLQWWPGGHELHFNLSEPTPRACACRGKALCTLQTHSFLTQRRATFCMFEKKMRWGCFQ